MGLVGFSRDSLVDGVPPATTKLSLVLAMAELDERRNLDSIPCSLSFIAREFY